MQVNKMNPILLQIATTDSLGVSSTENITILQSSIWFLLAIIELLVILFLIYRLKRVNNNLAFNDVAKKDIKKSQKTDIDMDNLMNSINGSRELYKELSKKCHPDRFANTDKQDLAEKIFQEISKNKRDFGKLSALKLRAEKELNINFK